MKTQYKKTVLENNLRVISERIDYVRSVSLGVWVTTGARNEKKEENGISHMIEHMVFKGTNKRTAKDIAKSLESVGGYLDAFTSKEETCYYARTLDEHLPIALDVISDIATNSTFSEKALEKEKKVVLEEIKGVEDTPDELIHDIFVQVIFDGHPLGQTILGSAQNCKRWNSEVLKNFWKNHYSYDSVIVVCAGNVEHERLVEGVKKAFVFPSKTNDKTVDILPKEVPRIKIRRKKISQTHISIGRRGIPYTHSDRYPLLVLNTVLGAGMSSHLFQSVREREGLAYTVFSYADMYKDSGIFGVYLGVDSSKVVEAIRLVMKEIEDLRKNGISDSELIDAKNQLKGNLMLGLESTSNRMMRIAKLEMYLGKYVSLDETTGEIDKITKEDVMRVAEEVVDPKKFSIVILGPLKEEKISFGDVLP